MINLICATSSITHSHDPQQTGFSSSKSGEAMYCNYKQTKSAEIATISEISSTPTIDFQGVNLLFASGRVWFWKGSPEIFFWLNMNWDNQTSFAVSIPKKSLKNKYQYPPWNSHSLKHGPVWKEMSFSNHQLSGANCSFSGGYLFIARNLGFTTGKMKFFIRDLGTKRPAPGKSAGDLFG